jgi:hypothetical protein
MTDPNKLDGTLVKRQRAWLITCEWDGDHARVEDYAKVAAILDSRISDRAIEEMVERIYVNTTFSYPEQLAYSKTRKNNAPRVQHGTVAVDQELRKKTSLPPRVPISEVIICGENPWLWARIVYEVEAYVDTDGKEHLKWKELQQGVWNGREIEAAKVERHWIR